VRHLPFDDEGALDKIDSSIAAVVVEPAQAEGGVRVPEAGFIRALREQCDRAGAILVFDEVLTGFGRTGKMFALEHFGVVPDIIVMAKAIGGGLPLGALCSRNEVLGTLSHDPPLGHITTFGGHPLSCAAGLASLNVIVRERLCERGAAIGQEIVRRILAMHAPEIAAVRGLGMLIGIEFREAAIAHRFVAATVAHGVIVNWTLNADNVVRLAPVLTIAPDEVDFGLSAMSKALDVIRC
jgi:acetylornithine/succinyldiaminopimelate/putrescine aminotransferase